MKRIALFILSLCLTIAAMAGCGAKGLLDPNNPVTLTMWHNFGGDMQQTMDTLIDEFNATVGKEQGVIISVETITSTAHMEQTLSRIVNGDPGAPKMPDIVTAYPKTAIRFHQKGMLANLDDHFTKAELSAYIPSFVDEGRLGDGGLYVFPFAKSTELLFVNQTLFERFSTATGITTACFATFEGIADASAAYYAWTDAQTPAVLGDGKQFFTADSWINLAQAGMLQQGTTLFDGETLALAQNAYKHIWETCYAPCVSGGFAVYDGYSSDLSKTGDIVCSIGSSAGILFYGDSVTYPNNTTERVSYSILPYPVFKNGERIAIQRGNGLMVAKSNKQRETAAALFLKWFTAPEQNMRFVAETGYLPVTAAAFQTLTPQRMDAVENPRVREMLEAVIRMYADYTFFVAPVFERFDSASKQYEARYKTLMTQQREAFINGSAAQWEDALEAFIAGLRK